MKTGSDRIDAVVVDEESVGSVNATGCGGKVLRGDGALERYLAAYKLKESAVYITHCLIYNLGLNWILRYNNI